MRPDPSAWLGTLEPEKPRNARSWDGSAGSGAIVPPSEIRNAATLDDARRAAGLNPHLAQREDTREAFIKGRETREAKTDASDVLDPIPSQERRLDVLRAALARGDEPDEIREAWPTWWAVGGNTKTERMWHRDLAALRAEQAPVAAPKEAHVKDPKEVTEARRERLRAYLHEHGESRRTALVKVLGYDKGRSKSAAVQQLNDDCKAIGAGPLKANGRTVVLGEDVVDEKPAARVPPAKIVNTIGDVNERLADEQRRREAREASADFDALLAELSEASVDLDRALVRVEKAKAAVKEAAGR